MLSMGSFAAAATSAAGLLALVAACGWVAPASAQSLVNQATMTPSDVTNIWGAGYYDDHVYFATTDFNNQDNRGLVYKIATGNAGGPSDTTAPSVINTLEFTAIFYGGVVDSRNGLGYWVMNTDPIMIAKTSGNAGSAPMTRVGGGSGEMTFGAGDSGYSIALDEINNMLYVRGETYIYKLSAGDATQLPTYHNTLTDMLNGEGYFYGIAVDAKNGYGYATSSNSSPYGVLMFALGEGTGPMTRIGV